MKRRLLLMFLAIAVLSSAAMAGNNPCAKVAVHVKGHSSKQGCSNLPSFTNWSWN